MSQQALDLVNPLPESQDHAADISILTLKAVADARLHQFYESEGNLQRAQKLCAETSKQAVAEYCEREECWRWSEANTRELRAISIRAWHSLARTATSSLKLPLL